MKSAVHREANWMLAWRATCSGGLDAALLLVSSCTALLDWDETPVSRARAMEARKVHSNLSVLLLPYRSETQFIC